MRARWRLFVAPWCISTKFLSFFITGSATWFSLTLDQWSFVRPGRWGSVEQFFPETRADLHRFRQWRKFGRQEHATGRRHPLFLGGGGATNAWQMNKAAFLKVSNRVGGNCQVCPAQNYSRCAPGACGLSLARTSATFFRDCWHFCIAHAARRNSSSIIVYLISALDKKRYPAWTKRHGIAVLRCFNKRPRPLSLEASTWRLVDRDGS